MQRSNPDNTKRCGHVHRMDQLSQLKLKGS